MHLTSQQQQEYIQAMGIEPWYPRVKLANSLEPLSLAPTEESAPVQALPATSAVSSISPAPASETPVVTPSNTPTSHQAQTPPATAPVQAVDGTEQPIRFGLGLYVYGDWLVVSSLVSDYQVHQEASAALVSAILVAIGNEPVKPSYHHVISWPFFSNSNASQGVSAANQYVTGVIEHLMEEHSVSKFMVFGGVLPKLQGWQSIEGGDFGLRRIVLPSVYKMLSDPSQKRQAWSLLRNSSFFK